MTHDSTPNGWNLKDSNIGIHAYAGNAEPFGKIVPLLLKELNLPHRTLVCLVCFVN